MKTKNEIFAAYKMNKIIESKKTVLNIDILLTGVILIGVIGSAIIF